MKFLEWLKRNWVNIAALIVAVLGGADVAAGLSAGKSIANVAVIPSLVGATGAAGTLLVRLLSGRGKASVSYPAVTDGLDAETVKFLESLCVVAVHVDVTPEMVVSLSNIASAAVIGHVARVKAAQASEVSK